MFNKTLVEIYTWFDIFININYSFTFVIIFSYVLTTVIICNTNINFFLNIYMFLLALTVFLFNFNSGPYAGFLFLCETTSLFSIFVILNKILNDENFRRQSTRTFEMFALFFIISLFIISFKVSIQLPFLQQLNYFVFDTLNSNDFVTTLYLFYQNSYFCFALINLFLLIITFFVINSLLIFLNKSVKVQTLKFNNILFSNIILNFLSNNNIVNVKLKNFLNAFKK